MKTPQIKWSFYQSLLNSMQYYAQRSFVSVLKNCAKELFAKFWSILSFWYIPICLFFWEFLIGRSFFSANIRCKKLSFLLNSPTAEFFWSQLLGVGVWWIPDAAMQLPVASRLFRLSDILTISLITLYFLILQVIFSNVYLQVYMLSWLSYSFLTVAIPQPSMLSFSVLYEG